MIRVVSEYEKKILLLTQLLDPHVKSPIEPHVKSPIEPHVKSPKEPYVKPPLDRHVKSPIDRHVESHIEPHVKSPKHRHVKSHRPIDHNFESAIGRFFSNLGILSKFLQIISLF